MYLLGFDISRRSTESPNHVPSISPAQAMMKHSRGVIYAYIGVMTLLLAVIIGLVIYIVNNSPKTQSPPATNKNNTSSTTSISYAGWKTYANDAAGVMFRYPSDWTIQTTTSPAQTNGSFAGVSGTVISRSGNKLTWVYQEVGSKNVPACTTSPKDVPFAQTNQCATKQISLVEQLSSVTPKPDRIPQSLFGSALYLTETKYQAGASSSQVSGAPTYQICLDPYTNDGSSKLPVVGTVIGAVLPCEYNGVGFNAEFSVQANGFGSSDAVTAIDIMKSFNSYSAETGANAVTAVQLAYSDVLNYETSTTFNGEAEINAIKDYLDPQLYAQLLTNSANTGVDQILCSQLPPASVSGSLYSTTGNVADVTVKEVFPPKSATAKATTANITVAVNLNSMTISNINCPSGSL